MGDMDSEKRNDVIEDVRSRDLKGTGVLLIITGSAGLVGVILWMLGVFSVNMNGVMKYISASVMGFLFLVFVLSGFNALKKSKAAAADAVRKSEKRDEIMKWFLGEYDDVKIDEAIKAAADQQEEAEEASQEGSGTSLAEEETEDPDETEDEAEAEDEAEDEALDIEENEKYFERTGFIRGRISERFLELDEELLSDIIDSIYTEIFG